MDLLGDLLEFFGIKHSNSPVKLPIFYAIQLAMSLDWIIKKAIEMAFCDETEYWLTADDEPLWLHQCGPISPDLYPQQTPVVVCVSLQGSCKSPAVQTE